MTLVGGFHLLPVLAALAIATPAAAADDVASFYKNLQMKMVIRSEAAGTYDTFGRLLARHMGRHIPGNPTMLPINMPGASGIKAANYMAVIAPRDGSIIGNVSFGFPGMQAMGLLDKVGGDMRDFNWIGSFNATNQVLVLATSSPTKTLDDAKTRETLVGASTIISTAAQLPIAFNIFLGTKFKIIPGYQGIAAQRLAMERGEIEGLGANGWDDLKTDFSEMLSKKQLNTLIQVGMEKDDELPNTPLLIDQAKDADQRAVLKFLTEANSSLGKPFATTPGVPADRVKALRDAFNATMQDKAFLDDAKKVHAEIRPIRGETLKKLVDDIVATPPDVIAKVKSALGDSLGP
jgi:tripartite-type tricarboxylate transporter receptor subunit TctC